MFDGAISKVRETTGRVVSSVADAVTNPRDAVQEVVDAVSQPSEALGQAKQAASDLFDTLPSGVQDAARGVGSFTWKHKGEIAFWVGSAALLAAIPVTGGASGALQGALMAGRGASMVHKLKTAAAATKIGGQMSRANAAVRSARETIGATQTGSTLARAQKPLTTALTGFAGAALADDLSKASQGDVSYKNIALDVLGLVPAGSAAVNRFNKFRQARTERSAPKVVRSEIDMAARQTEAATRRAEAIADKADEAVATPAAIAADEAQYARSATQAVRARVSDGDADAATLRSALEQVESSTAAARNQLAAVKQTASSRRLTKEAEVATAQLEHARRHARAALDKIRAKVAKSQRLDTTIRRTERVERLTGSTAAKVGIANNAANAANSSGYQHQKDVASSIRGIVGTLLARNARAPMATTTTAPERFAEAARSQPGRVA